MQNSINLEESILQLTEIINKTHNEKYRKLIIKKWKKHLNEANPIWNHLEVKKSFIKKSDDSAHSYAIIDKRLPNIGLIGYFETTNKELGHEVLKDNCEWLRAKGIKEVFGPINGNITVDYRFNLSEDYVVPGEPINPGWYIDIFKESNFDIYNRYVSGISRHYSVFIKFISLYRPTIDISNLSLRSIESRNGTKDLSIYHNLMNAIFPFNSVYCPKISLKERLYNISDDLNIFDPKYSFFLEDNDRPIGLIVAYSHNNDLIIKTLGIIPEYQNKKLSGLLIKKVHDQAKKDNLNNAIYSTIRVGNRVYKMKRPGVKIFRKYITLRRFL